jgi:hypothetical protein
MSMATLRFIVKGPTVWVGLLALALGLTFGLRAPMPAGLSLIGLGTMGFVMSIVGRLALASHLAYRARQLGLDGGRGVSGAAGTRTQEESPRSPDS